MSTGMVEYQVMARLSQSPERTLRMSSLADLAGNASLSRLSHLVMLEERGLVRGSHLGASGGSPMPPRPTRASRPFAGTRTRGPIARHRCPGSRPRRLGLAADRIMSRIDTSSPGNQLATASAGKPSDIKHTSTRGSRAPRPCPGPSGVLFHILCQQGSLVPENT